MAEEQAPPAGPDLTQGVASGDFSGATLLGHVGDQDVLLVRSGPEIFAIDAHCSHYHGPLAEGLVVGDSIRCPWHHACFDLRSGEATRAPALNALAVWQVEHEGDRIFVRRKREQPKPRGKGAGRCARQDRDRRRRRGRPCSGRHAAAAGVSRQHRDAQQRCRARRWIGRTCRRITSPAARRRTGCRCVPTAFTRRPASTSASTSMSRRSIPRRAMSSSPTAAPFPMTACCWRPAPSRFGYRSPAPTSRMSMSCVRLRIAGRSLNPSRVRAGRS